jgi:hypothetical protein
MTHYCRVCCKRRPDNRFTAAGRKARVCKDCAKLPKEQRDFLEADDDLKGLVAQSNLSAANVTRLKVLVKSTHASVRERAQVLLEVARLHPHRSKRDEYLREKQPALWEAFQAAFAVSAEAEAEAEAESAERAEDEPPAVATDDVSPA